MAFLKQIVAFLLLPLFTGRAEPILLIDSFSDLNFRIASESMLTSDVYETARASDAGPMDFRAYVGACEMNAGGGEIAINLTSAGGALAGLSFEFPTPIDLSQFDYIEVGLRHKLPRNPISGVYLKLMSGAMLERRNLSMSPILPSQTRIGIYEFESSWDYWIHSQNAVRRIDVAFETPHGVQGEVVYIDSVSFGSMSPKSRFNLSIRRMGSDRLQVKADRTFGSMHLYRLEASFDLRRWFDKSGWIQGDGSTPVFSKVFSDARYYRMSYYNLVPQAEAASPTGVTDER